MSVTILEALQNAHYNLSLPLLPRPIFNLARSQLKNSITLLEKGYSIHDDIEPLLECYGKIENVPNKGGGKE